MQDVAQLVRVLVCGAGGRGFEPHLPAKSLVEQTRLFLCCLLYDPSIFHNRQISKNYFRHNNTDVFCGDDWVDITF